MRIYNKVKGVTIALLVFILIHYSITYIANSVANTQENYLTFLPWLNFAVFFVYFLCGLLASIFYENNFVLIGLVTGLLSALVAITLFNVAVNDMSGMLMTITIGMLLSGFGGVISMLIKPRLKNTL